MRHASRLQPNRANAAILFLMLVDRIVFVAAARHRHRLRPMWTNVDEHLAFDAKNPIITIHSNSKRKRRRRRKGWVHSQQSIVHGFYSSLFRRWNERRPVPSIQQNQQLPRNHQIIKNRLPFGRSEDEYERKKRMAAEIWLPGIFPNFHTHNRCILSAI